jgi:LysM repeat protein
MKPLIRVLLPCGLALFLSGCAQHDSTAGGHPQGTGPFDSRGNYREDWADDPSKWRRPGSTHPASVGPAIAANERPPANATPLPPVRSAAPKPAASAPAVAAVKPKPVVKPAPKPVAKPKPKPAPKPASVTYTVKKGDTLSGIASRHGTSVSAIRSANGISGSIIRPGQRLRIPKR